jgi:hypothetical protein
MTIPVHLTLAVVRTRATVKAINIICRAEQRRKVSQATELIPIKIPVASDPSIYIFKRHAT